VQLGDRDRAVLDLEREWWLCHHSKEDAVRERLNLAPSSYYRLLHAVIENPAAMAYDPLVVRRLRRARLGRRRVRMEGTWAGQSPRKRPYS
jgi:hypothetical protein